MSEEITEAKFWRDRFYHVSIMNEKSMEIIKLLMERANKKEWVGLTDEEINDISGRMSCCLNAIAEAEATLKEKNT